MLGFHIIFAFHSRISGLGVIQVLAYLGPLALVSGGAKHSAIGREQLSSLDACARITGAHEKDHDHSRDILGPILTYLLLRWRSSNCGPRTCWPRRAASRHRLVSHRTAHGAPTGCYSARLSSPRSSLTPPLHMYQYLQSPSVPWSRRSLTPSVWFSQVGFAL